MPKQVDFAKEFNRRLGQYTGNLAQPTPESVNNLDLPSRLSNIREQFMQSLIKDRIDAMNKPGGGGGVPKTTYDPEVLGNLTQKSLNLITEAGKSKKFMGIKAPNIWEIPGPIGRALGPVDEALIGLNIQAPLKLAGTTLDLLSRPAYSEFEATRRQAEAYNEGQSFKDQLGAMAHGAWEGLKGDKKTGYGDVVEAWSNVPAGKETGGGNFGQMLFNATVGAGFPRLISEELLNPGEKNWKDRWAKRTIGLAGDVVLDPTNLVGGKVIGSLKGPADEVAQFTEDAYRAIAKDAAEREIANQGLAGRVAARPRLRNQVVDPISGLVTTSKQLPAGKAYVDEAMDKAFDDTMFQVGSGATGGRLAGHNQTPFAVANNAGIALRQHLTSDLDNLVRYFADNVRSGTPMTSAQINQMRQSEPLMGEFFDELLRLSRKSRSAHTYNDIEQVLLDYAKHPGPGLLDNVAEASTHAKSQLNNSVLSVQDAIHEALLGTAFNAPGIKIAGKTIPMSRLGLAYADRKLAKAGGGILKDVKYGDTFVGRTPQVAQRVRSLGMARYEQFHRAVTNMVNGKAEIYDVVTHKMHTVNVERALTRAERKTIHTNILNGIVPQDSRLREAQEFVQTAYKKMFQEEVDAGLRTSKEVQAPNYVYNYYKGSDVRNKIDEFRGTATKGMKGHINRTGQMNPNQLALAKAKGLRPEEDAFRALLHRQLKSNRQLTRKWFEKDLLDNYGVMANQLSPDIAEKMRLVEKYTHKTLPSELQKKLGMTKPGDKWYLPQDIQNVLKAFEDLSGGKPQQLQGLIRFFDNWTRYFKTAATIPWPGFHIRNSIGDIFMSWIDGVRSSDIAFLKNWDLSARKNPGAVREIGGRNFTFDEMRNIFRENASSGGYQKVELLPTGSGASLSPTGLAETAKGLAKDPRGVGNLARRASGAREDLFRFNHFLHAFKEEYPKALKEVKNPERAMKRAIDASTYRINKYMFDYGALTGIEQKYLKRVFPFYTYTRKVMPTLMESLFLHPSQFSKTNRIFLDDAGDTTYNDMLTPQYQREIGYSRLSPEEDHKDPWLLGGQFLPTDVLNRNLNFSSVSGFFQNLTSQVNPFGKAPFELAGHTQYFNDQPIESTGGYLSDAMLPPVRPLEDIPGIGDAFSKLPGVGQTRKEGFIERVVSGRMGLGLPVDKVNEGQQTAAAYGLKDEIEQKLAQYDTELEKRGYKLYLSTKKSGSGPSFSIRRLTDDVVIYETTNVDDAVDKAEALIKD